MRWRRDRHRAGPETVARKQNRPQLAPRPANPSSNAFGYLTGVTLVQVESGL